MKKTRVESIRIPIDKTEFIFSKRRVKKERIDVSFIGNDYNVNDQTPDVTNIQFSKFLRENPAIINVEYPYPGRDILKKINNIVIHCAGIVYIVQIIHGTLMRMLNNALRSRISNDGSYAAEGEYPYHGALMRSGAYWCGASLVSARHVLTAAHCVKDLVDVGWPGGARPRVKLGSTSLETSRVHEVTRISYHRDYDPVWLLADIAVVTLSEPVVFSRRVRPIDLPKPFEELPPGRRLIVTGYGRDDRSRARSVRLKPLATRLIGNEQCSKDWFVTPSKLCTLRGPNNYGTCTVSIYKSNKSCLARVNELQ
ncbi:unnamed protein product [Trichogramma brassicae]|uniref:Peptidase S1 domain-containing protein n=1 Tax=Trichogramma brassicae TaxID=86971 RepID=A0A6H5J5H0_9HYME|nr:unnamed protein product [Trichogramma brassicae]